MIDDNVMFVKEFGLFSTTLRRVDGQETVVQNSILASTKLVHNVRRSGSHWVSSSLRSIWRSCWRLGATVISIN